MLFCFVLFCRKACLAYGRAAPCRCLAVVQQAHLLNWAWFLFCFCSFVNWKFTVSLVAVAASKALFKIPKCLTGKKKKKKMFILQERNPISRHKAWMKVSFWQTVIRTELTEAARCHFYILFIGSFSRFLWKILVDFIPISTSWTVFICLRMLPNRRTRSRWRQPRIREDFPSFNKQLNDTVLRLNLLKEAQEQCGVSRRQGIILIARNISSTIQNFCCVHLKNQQTSDHPIESGCIHQRANPQNTSL